MAVSPQLQEIASWPDILETSLTKIAHLSHVMALGESGFAIRAQYLEGLISRVQLTVARVDRIFVRLQTFNYLVTECRLVLFVKNVAIIKYSKQVN